MASLVNSYFNQSKTIEQTLLNNLVVESIQVTGRTYYYIPRELVKEDLLLGEDALSKFPLAIPIEMYLQDVTGFEGQKEIFSKFGLQIQSSYKLVVAKSRWEKEVKSVFDGSTGAAPFAVKTYLRPQEGDLIWDPTIANMFEIKFCDHDVEFFALGTNYMYYLTCELFQYAHEEITTGIPEIDTLADLMSLDLLKDQILAENGDKIVLEECNEDYILQDITTTVEDRSRKFGVDFDLQETTEQVVIKDPFA